MLHDSYDFEYVVNDDDDKSIKKVKSIGDVQENPIPGWHSPSYGVEEKTAALPEGMVFITAVCLDTPAEDHTIEEMVLSIERTS